MKTRQSFFAGIALICCVGLCPVQGAETAGPQIESEAAIVIDEDSGDILYEKNGSQLYYPASITKILTALVVAENCRLEDTVIFSHDAVYNVEAGSGNNIQLEAGDKLSVQDCLYAMILESSNQAANALAEHTAGSQEAFAALMNQRIKELGCTDSTFVNPSGLNDSRQQTSAREMALIAAAAFANETVKEICSTTQYTISPTLNNPQGYPLTMEHQLLTENKIYDYPYAVAGKTGYTSLAGNTLVTSAEKDGDALIAVILQSELTHYEDTIQLLDYGFEILAAPELPADTENLFETAALEISGGSSAQAISGSTTDTTGSSGESADTQALSGDNTDALDSSEKSTGSQPQAAHLLPVFLIGGTAAAGMLFFIRVRIARERQRRRQRQLRQRRKRTRKAA